MPNQMMAISGVAAHPAFTGRRPGEDRWIEHSLRVPVHPAVAYEVMADLTLWPLIFEPIISASPIGRFELGPGVEADRVLIESRVGGCVQRTVLIRRQERRRLTIELCLDGPSGDLATWRSRWSFQPQGRATRAVVATRFLPASATLRSIDRTFWAVDGNDRGALRALRRTVGGHPAPTELVVRQHDTVTLAAHALPGRRPEHLYNLVARADQWPRYLPGLDGAKLSMSISGVHDLAVTSRASDGSPYVSRCTRIVEWGSRIAFRYTDPPPGLIGLSGEWTFRSDAAAETVTATCLQVALLSPDAVASVASVEVARSRTATALSSFARAVLAPAVGDRTLPVVRLGRVDPPLVSVCSSGAAEQRG